MQPNWTYEASLYVWDGPGHPEPTSAVESQQMSTDDDGAALFVFFTNINNEDNSSTAQWAKVIVNGVATEWLQASCDNPPTFTPTNTPTSTNTPTATPTATPPSTLAVEIGLQIFAGLQTCVPTALITGGEPSTSYPVEIYVQDNDGPITGQPIVTGSIFTFGDGSGRLTFSRTLINNTEGLYAQAVVLGVGSGWLAVSSATCAPS